MNCFYHDSAAAVGICKHCSKALCHACLMDTGNGIACSSTCVEDVQILNRLISRTRNTTSHSDQNAFLTPLFLFSTGVLFTIYGLLNPGFSLFPISAGTLFIILSGIFYFRIRQWLKAAQAPQSGRTSSE